MNQNLDAEPGRGIDRRDEQAADLPPTHADHDDQRGGNHRQPGHTLLSHAHRGRSVTPVMRSATGTVRRLKSFHAFLDKFK